jgi:hypothetical protein
MPRISIAAWTSLMEIPEPFLFFPFFISVAPFPFHSGKVHRRSYYTPSGLIEQAQKRAPAGLQSAFK